MLGGIVSFLTVVVGTLVVLGWVLPPQHPPVVRWMAGGVLVLYGFYRGYTLLSRVSTAGREEQEDHPSANDEKIR